MLGPITSWLTRPRILTAAFLSVVILSVAYWNVAHLVVLRDHPLPSVIFWPAVWVLLGMTVTLLVPSSRRTGAGAALAFGATGLAVLCAGGVTVLAGVFISSAPSGELIDHASSPDGRYEVRILHWRAVLGEDGWDVVVQRRDGLRFVEADAGCLFSEDSGGYESIQSVEAGSVRIVTGAGPVAITFDPATMQMTKPIPASLCPGY
ncbi:hypothetical protein [Actinoplanes sp. NPDC049802]|uniref:hypothetical protein n=1 Tax=Actinoplanes sp. NPDC049802 TaxID=3154742 RepID=UPI0034018CD5